MNTLIERFVGLDKLTDEVIAMDFLITAKSGVRNYAMAVTECASPETRAVLTNQLDQALDLFERISCYMVQKGWYHPHNVQEQIQLDLQNMETALNIPS